MAQEHSEGNKIWTFTFAERCAVSLRWDSIKSWVRRWLRPVFSYVAAWLLHSKNKRWPQDRRTWSKPAIISSSSSLPSKEDWYTDITSRKTWERSKTNRGGVKETSSSFYKTSQEMATMYACKTTYQREPGKCVTMGLDGLIKDFIGKVCQSETIEYVFPKTELTLSASLKATLVRRSCGTLSTSKIAANWRFCKTPWYFPVTERFGEFSPTK